MQSLSIQYTYTLYPSQRFETAWIQRRFSETSYQFYSLGNSPPGLAWLINPRDLVGSKENITHQVFFHFDRI